MEVSGLGGNSELFYNLRPARQGPECPVSVSVQPVRQAVSVSCKENVRLVPGALGLLRPSAPVPPVSRSLIFH